MHILCIEFNYYITFYYRIFLLLCILYLMLHLIFSFCLKLHIAHVTSYEMSGLETFLRITINSITNNEVINAGEKGNLMSHAVTLSIKKGRGFLKHY